MDTKKNNKPIRKMKVTIDLAAGFCFGVDRAIQAAEKVLKEEGVVYSLGDIVHNSEELERLIAKGLKVISNEDLPKLAGAKVLIRAHGEPPETFKTAQHYGINLIDATCPVVRKLQEHVGNSFKKGKDNNSQLVIFGKSGHAEVVGLNGQTGHKAIVISGLPDLEKIDFKRPVILYSQTTMDSEALVKITNEIRKRLTVVKTDGNPDLEVHNSICRQVGGRAPGLKKFARSNDVVVFVSGKKSSNGAYLFEVCKEENPNSYFVSEPGELETQWFKNADTVGVTGATSTPEWLMVDVARVIETF
jgi:4-hydroxy-3-methylbut-2-en-1-yl diphosphate reductase